MHEEFHSPAFTRRGGTLEMAQLWVNLPARIKMTPPRYQSILARDIPVVTLPEGCRITAGDRRGSSAKRGGRRARIRR